MKRRYKKEKILGSIKSLKYYKTVRQGRQSRVTGRVNKKEHNGYKWNVKWKFSSNFVV